MMMRDRGISLTLLLVPCLACTAAYAGNRPTIEAVLSPPDTLEVRPGGLVKSGAVIMSRCGGSGEVIDEIHAPSAWKIVTPEDPGFLLEAGDRVLRLMVLHVPQSCPPGDYEITYYARCRGDPGAADTARFVVRVPYEIRLEAESFAGPAMLVAGGVWRASLKLSNKGNSSVNIGLDVRSLPEGAVDIVPRAATLEPAETDTFMVVLKTEKRLRQKTRYAVEVTAEGEAHGGAALAVTRTACVDVVPRVSGTPDPYHRLPMNIQVVTAVESGVGRTQGAVSASGSLDEGGERRIGFMFRGPDIDDAGRYGKRDEYWLHYEDDNQSLTIGDRTYSLSPLTQRFSYGRGVEVRRRWGGLELAGMYIETGQDRSKQERVGAEVGYSLSERLGIKATFLTKNVDSTLCGDCGRIRLYSLGAGVAKGSFDINGEYGISYGDGDTAPRDNAYRVESRGQIAGKIGYSAETIHAGRDFAGYYRGTDNTIARMTFPLYGRLTGSAFYYYFRSRPQSEAESQTADRVQTVKGGLSYQSGGGFQVSLDCSQYRKRDTLMPSGYDFAEETVELGLGRSFGWLGFHGRIERGRYESHLNHLSNDNLERYSLSASLRPLAGQLCVVYLRTGHARFSDDPERELTAGMSVRLGLGGRLRFNVDCVTNRKVKEATSESYSIMASAAIDLPHGHSLSVRGHVFMKDVGEDESAMYFVYGIPVGLRAGKRKSTGSLKGRIYDQEMAGQVPIPGAVLFTNGTYAVTSKDGEFIFPALRPGTHSLQIESGSLDRDKVTAERLPIEVSIQGAKTSEIDIGVVTACRLAGAVRLHTFKHDEGFQARYMLAPGSAQGPDDSTGSDASLPELVDAGGVRIMVEITDGTGTLRQYTSERGEFEFDHIRPGTWHVRFNGEDIPDLYHLEKEEFVVNLDPGDESRVLARVLPSIRPVRMIDGGLITQVGDTGR